MLAFPGFLPAIFSSHAWIPSTWKFTIGGGLSVSFVGGGGAAAGSGVTINLATAIPVAVVAGLTLICSMSAPPGGGPKISKRQVAVLACKEAFDRWDAFCGAQYNFCLASGSSQPFCDLEWQACRDASLKALADCINEAEALPN
jgi:hypothetical protein